jgi:hypothetical protein
VNLCIAPILALVATAHAEPRPDRLMLAVDSYVSSLGGDLDTAAVADVATTIFYEYGGPRDVYAIRFDLVDRESLIGGLPRRELHELNLTLGRERDPLSVRIGRQRVPGGFWLFADGIAVRHAISKRTTVAVVGGLRSFSNARAELLLRSAPVFAGVAGLAVTVQTDHSQLGASLVSTRDIVTLPRGLDPVLGAFEASATTPGTPLRSTHVLPELFVDVSAITQPSKRVTAFGGITVGNRYEVELSPRPDLLIDDPTVRSRLLRSLGAFAAVDHRPSRHHRFLWSLNTVIAKTTFEVDGDDTERPSASFVEVGGRYRWTASKRLRWTAGNRLRFRDGSLVERSTLGVLVGHPERTSLAIEAGVDLRLGKPTGEGYVARRSWVTNASLQHRSGGLDARVGVSYADVLPGSTIAALREDAPVELRLFPFTLEAQRFTYVRAMYQAERWSIGADIEWALTNDQARALLQIGYAR